MKKSIQSCGNPQAFQKITASHGSIDEMLDAFENRIQQLENYDEVNMSTDVLDDDSIEECNKIASDEDILSGEEQYYFDVIEYRYPKGVELVADLFGMDYDECDEFIQELCGFSGYSANDIQWIGDDGIDNPKICFKDGTIWMIDGNYGNEYLSDTGLDANQIVSSACKVQSGTEYYDTDPRNLISEEEMQEQAIGAILSVMDQSGLDLDDAYQSWIDWCTEIGQWAKKQVESGRVKSMYDR